MRDGDICAIKLKGRVSCACQMIQKMVHSFKARHIGSCFVEALGCSSVGLTDSNEYKGWVLSNTTSSVPETAVAPVFRIA